jgi:hypothetical protein
MVTTSEVPAQLADACTEQSVESEDRLAIIPKSFMNDLL